MSSTNLQEHSAHPTTPDINTPISSWSRGDWTTILDRNLCYPHRHAAHTSTTAYQTSIVKKVTEVFAMVPSIVVLQFFFFFSRNCFLFSNCCECYFRNAILVYLFLPLAFKYFIQYQPTRRLNHSKFRVTGLPLFSLTSSPSPFVVSQQSFYTLACGVTRELNLWSDLHQLPLVYQTYFGAKGVKTRF